MDNKNNNKEEKNLKVNFAHQSSNKKNISAKEKITKNNNTNNNLKEGSN